jgi:hypothetical protein
MLINPYHALTTLLILVRALRLAHFYLAEFPQMSHDANDHQGSIR